MSASRSTVTAAAAAAAAAVRAPVTARTMAPPGSPRRGARDTAGSSCPSPECDDAGFSPPRSRLTSV